MPNKLGAPAQRPFPHGQKKLVIEVEELPKGGFEVRKSLHTLGEDGWWKRGEFAFFRVEDVRNIFETIKRMVGSLG